MTYTHHRTAHWTPLCEVIGLFSLSNLWVTISGVSISVFKGRFLDRALIGPGRFKVYVSYYLIKNFTVRCLFYLRADTGKQIIDFFATNNYNSLIYTNFAVPVFRCCAVHLLRNVRYGLILKGLSLEERRILSYFRYFFQWRYDKKSKQKQFKRNSGRELWRQRKILEWQVMNKKMNNN